MRQESIFLDENQNRAPPETARWLVVTEYDAKGKLVSEAWVDLDDNPSLRKSLPDDDHSEEKAQEPGAQPTLQVSTYSPPQKQGDPIFKELFLEQPVLDEEVKKADVPELSDDSTALIAEAPQSEDLPEEKEKREEKPSADDEERELRRRYLLEKLELVRDIRKRINRGDEGV